MENWPTLQKQYFAALEQHFEQWSERYTDLRLTTDIRVATWKGKRIKSKAEAGKWWFREALGAQDQSGKRLREQIVILGDPGGGKSTACQRATWELAREGREALDHSRYPVTPVYLELGAYRKDSPQLQGLAPSQRILKLLSRRIEGFLENVPLNWSQLQTYMGSCPFLFFLDGLNEVGQNQRQALIADIKGFIAQFSGQNHQFVLTTRKFDYEYDFAQHFPTDNFEPLEILELDSAGVNEFIMRDLGQITQAYAYVGKLPAEEQAIAKTTLDRLKIGDVTTGKDLLAEAQQLFANNPDIVLSLEAAEGLMDVLGRPEYERVLWLAQNPGTLRDIIDVYQDKGDIPRSRSRLSEEAIQARLRAQAAKRSRESLLFSQVIKLDVLQAIGFYMMDVNKGLIIAHQDVLTIFVKHVRQEEAKLLLNELIFSDGLLVEPEEKWYAFVKQPYQEYFVARELRDRWLVILEEGKDPLRDNRMQEFLQNRVYIQVTSAMAGLLDQEKIIFLTEILWKNASTRRLAALCICKSESIDKSMINKMLNFSEKAVITYAFIPQVATSTLFILIIITALKLTEYIYKYNFYNYAYLTYYDAIFDGFLYTTFYTIWIFITSSRFNQAISSYSKEDKKSASLVLYFLIINAIYYNLYFIYKNYFFIKLLFFIFFSFLLLLLLFSFLFLIFFSFENHLLINVTKYLDIISYLGSYSDRVTLKLRKIFKYHMMSNRIKNRVKMYISQDINIKFKYKTKMKYNEKNHSSKLVSTTPIFYIFDEDTEIRLKEVINIVEQNTKSQLVQSAIDSLGKFVRHRSSDPDQRDQIFTLFKRVVNDPKYPSIAKQKARKVLSDLGRR